MQTTVNLENDNFFIQLVKHNKIQVTRSGKVFNSQTAKQLGTSLKPKYAQIGWKIKGTLKVRHILIHRLVYIVHGDEVLGNSIVNHRDGNKRNNHISNLEPSTYSDNLKHAYANNLITVSPKTIKLLKNLCGEKARDAKLTNNQVKQIRKLHLSGKYNHRELSVLFKISRSGITNIINWKAYKEARFKFNIKKKTSRFTFKFGSRT